jgi:hypothetical protein
MSFPIECPRLATPGSAWRLLHKAFNAGIDSRLEAFTRSRFVAGGGEYGKDLFDIDDSELSILIRRLCELGEDSADSLADDIVSVAYGVETV